MKHRIISDTHFWHKFLEDIEDRKEWFENRLFDSINQIPEQDCLVHLWDICIWNDAKRHGLFIESLKCKKILVLGNHDGKSDNWYYNHWWDFVCRSFTMKKFGKELKFIHIPTPETKERATAKENRLVIHGHYHKWWRPGRLAMSNHVLYSCEYEDMNARPLQYMIELHGKNLDLD